MVSGHNSLKNFTPVTIYMTGHSCIKDTDKTKTIYFFPRDRYGLGQKNSEFLFIIIK